MSAITLSMVWSNKSCAAITAAQIRTQDVNDICRTKTSLIRNVPESVKHEIYIRDGHPEGNHKGEDGLYVFEADHKISLELGGSNDPSNLIIQDGRGSCNYHDKDKLENKLHALVCDNKISPHDAQTLIYDDWITGYKRYVDAKGCGL